MQYANEILISKGLLQKCHRARCHGLLHYCRIFMGGNEHDWQLDIHLLQSRLYLEARKARHLLIQDKAVGRNARFRLDMGNKVLAGSEGERVHCMRTDQSVQCTADCFIIINDDDRNCLFCIQLRRYHCQYHLLVSEDLH